MASWDRDTGERDMPDPHAGDETRLEEWRGTVAPDVEYADEDETGQLGLGVPGEQRAIPTLAKPAGLEDERGDSVHRADSQDPAQVRAMFQGLGWSVTE